MDHDWQLFGHLSLRNIINVNSEQLFEILVKLINIYFDPILFLYLAPFSFISMLNFDEKWSNVLPLVDIVLIDVFSYFDKFS